MTAYKPPGGIRSEHEAAAPNANSGENRRNEVISRDDTLDDIKPPSCFSSPLTISLAAFRAERGHADNKICVQLGRWGNGSNCRPRTAVQYLDDRGPERGGESAIRPKTGISSIRLKKSARSRNPCRGGIAFG